MHDTTTPSSTAMLDDLHATVAEHGQAVRDYMIGCLAARLESIPQGPEAWAAALKTSAQIAEDVAAYRREHEARHLEPATTR